MSVPSRPNTEPFTTPYQVFSGPGAIFENGQDIGIAERHGRHGQHNPGRRGQGRGSLDQAGRLTFDPDEAPRFMAQAHSVRVASTRCSRMAPSASSSS